jgi:hypothetical protein
MTKTVNANAQSSPEVLSLGKLGGLTRDAYILGVLLRKDGLSAHQIIKKSTTAIALSNDFEEHGSSWVLALFSGT